MRTGPCSVLSGESLKAVYEHWGRLSQGVERRVPPVTVAVRLHSVYDLAHDARAVIGQTVDGGDSALQTNGDS